MSNINTDILTVCKLLYEKDMLASTDGNVSVRVDHDTICITPSQRHKAFLSEDEMALIKLDGTVLKGKPSSESEMHLAVYRKTSKARAVVHAHPPYSIAWTIARPKLKELPCDAMAELILAVGAVPIIPYARPGTKGMGDNLQEYVEDHRVMILARHGALAWGEDIWEAYFGVERLEHSAKILAKAVALGGLTKLPPKEVKALREVRKKLGNKTL